MSRRPTPTSSAIAQFLRECRVESGLPLRSVAEKTTDAGHPIPASTICKIEQGLVEPGLVRLRTLLEVYGKPLQDAVCLLEFEGLAVEPLPSGEVDELYRTGLALLKQGKARDGLGLLLPLLQRGVAPSIQERALLSTSIGLQLVGKHRLAISVLEELLSRPVEAETRFKASVQAARAWTGLGQYEFARAFLARAEELSFGLSGSERALVLTNRARLDQSESCLSRAIERVREALALLRDSNDAINYVAGIAQYANLLLSAARGRDALRVSRAGISIERGVGSPAYRARLLLVEGRSLIEVNCPHQGLQRLRDGMSEAVRLGNEALRFLSHYHAWKGYLRIGNNERAVAERAAAEAFLAFSDESSIEAQEVRGDQLGLLGRERDVQVDVGPRGDAAHHSGDEYG